MLGRVGRGVAVVEVGWAGGREVYVAETLLAVSTPLACRFILHDCSFS